MGNAFVHVELNTGDVETAKKFYKQLFDWKLEDVPAGPGAMYTLLGVGKGVGGGMMQKPMPEAPTMWLPYVAVDDVRETIAKARAAGATIHVEHMEVPGMGWFGIFTDPTGATLAVWRPAMKAGAASGGKKKAAKKKAAKKKAAKKPAKKGKTKAKKRR